MSRTSIQHSMQLTSQGRGGSHWNEKTVFDYIAWSLTLNNCVSFPYPVCKFFSLRLFNCQYQPRSKLTRFSQRPPTRMSKNPGRSSKLLNGFACPPSLSMLPAHTFHDIGFSSSALITIAKARMSTETMVSITMSSGTVDADDGCSWLEREACS